MAIELISWSVDPERRDGSKSEVWHILRQSNAGRPLCLANTSGVVKRSKGWPSCRTCNGRLSVERLYDADKAALLAVHAGRLVASKAIEQSSDLIEKDLVVWDRRAVRWNLTERGRIAMMDLLSPAGFLEGKIFHGRAALQPRTFCGLGIAYPQGNLEVIARMHVHQKKTGRRKVTCLRCIASQQWIPVPGDRHD